MCLCLLIPEGLAATPWDPTNRGNTFYGATICAWLQGSVAQDPLPASAGCSQRETWVPQVASSTPSHTH